jgi:signal peptidase I
MERTWRRSVSPVVEAISQRPSLTRRRVRGGRVLEVLQCLFVAVVLVWGLEAMVARGYEVNGSSMAPLLNPGERVLASRWPYRFGEVQRGDIVVFRPPRAVDTPYVKRVIGLPGDLVEIRRGRVWVNGKVLHETYVRQPWWDNRLAERVPKGTLYVMGDNRDSSNDSRLFGEVPRAHVEARVWVRYWPLSRLGLVR